MKTIGTGHAVLAVLLGSAALLAQAPSASPGSSANLEFPVIMRQSVVAGATAVGSQVEAKLAVATLVNGVLVPQDAIFSGEVIESVAKSASVPSRLAIRMDSAQWRSGAVPKLLQLAKKVYLTAWYYPLLPPIHRHLSDELSDTAAGAGRGSDAPPPNPIPTYSGPNTFPSKQSSGHDLDRGTDMPPAPAPSISQHRVLMKNIESTRNNEGAVILVSKHSSIKSNKTTTYVLATGELGSGPG